MTTDVAVPVHTDPDTIAITTVAQLTHGATGLADAFYRLDTLDYYTNRARNRIVDEARQHGLSWATIGAALGVSGQAANKRYTPKESTR